MGSEKLRGPTNTTGNSLHAWGRTVNTRDEDHKQKLRWRMEGLDSKGHELPPVAVSLDPSSGPGAPSAPRLAPRPVRHTFQTIQADAWREAFMAELRSGGQSGDFERFFAAQNAAYLAEKGVNLVAVEVPDNATRGVSHSAEGQDGDAVLLRKSA